MLDRGSQAEVRTTRVPERGDATPECCTQGRRCRERPRGDRRPQELDHVARPESRMGVAVEHARHEPVPRRVDRAQPAGLEVVADLTDPTSFDGDVGRRTELAGLVEHMHVSKDERPAHRPVSRDTPPASRSSRETSAASSPGK